MCDSYIQYLTMAGSLWQTLKGKLTPQQHAQCCAVAQQERNVYELMDRIDFRGSTFEQEFATHPWLFPYQDEIKAVLRAENALSNENPANSQVFCVVGME